jgi:hypothetical protein
MFTQVRASHLGEGDIRGRKVQNLRPRVRQAPTVWKTKDLEIPTYPLRSGPGALHLHGCVTCDHTMHGSDRICIKHDRSGICDCGHGRNQESPPRRPSLVNSHRAAAVHRHNPNASRFAGRPASLRCETASARSLNRRAQRPHARLGSFGSSSFFRFPFSSGRPLVKAPPLRVLQALCAAARRLERLPRLCKSNSHAHLRASSVLPAGPRNPRLTQANGLTAGQQNAG